MKMTQLGIIIAGVFSASLISACGGGSASNGTTPTTPLTPTPPVTPTTPAGPDWEQGVFELASNFIAKCEIPRTGIDPFSGSAYPDTSGSALDEKLWLRSWTNNTYLWYDEVDDNDPENFSVGDYFDQLKTNALTPSNTPKDNFHFSQPTDEYNTLTQTGVSSGYGVSWEFESALPPRSLIVRYTEPGSPAATLGIPRGARLTGVNDVDFVNDNTQAGVDAINAALFPDENGVETRFTFELLDNTELSLSMTSSSIEVSPVQNVRVLETESGRTGYFQFNTFIRTAQDDLIDTFNRFSNENVTELVIDLRYNGGGLLALASQLSYMIAGPNQTNGATFETLRFNDKHPTTDPITGRTITPTPFYANEIDYGAGRLLSASLPSLSLTRVYVLTSDSTCSASEAVMNALRGIDVEVVQIGASTCGKPYGFYPTDNCGTTYFTIQFQGVNQKGFGDYADGFMPTASPNFDFELPGCSVNDDFTKALGSPEESMLAAALEYASSGTCPVIASSSPQGLEDIPSGVYEGPLLSIDTPDTITRRLILNNKINTMVIKEMVIKKMDIEENE
jgi:C-terminal processing protease CtpA/Prc